MAKTEQFRARVSIDGHQVHLGYQGRVQDVTVASDMSVVPGQQITVSLPGTADQVGKLQSVRWDLTDGVMDLGTSQLSEVA
ncbi:hypothetical protein ACFXP7_09320 [Microbacterium sp. P06]|uniref:hypothetical protein n=1 Tax=Microbacterium sp. P06 TaxID=3366949 RepID=UPI0037451E5C